MPRVLEHRADPGDEVPRPPAVRLRPEVAGQRGRRGERRRRPAAASPASVSASVDLPAPFGPDDAGHAPGADVEVQVRAPAARGCPGRARRPGPRAASSGSPRRRPRAGGDSRRAAAPGTHTPARRAARRARRGRRPAARRRSRRRPARGRRRGRRAAATRRPGARRGRTSRRSPPSTSADLLPQQRGRPRRRASRSARRAAAARAAARARRRARAAAARRRRGATVGCAASYGNPTPRSAAATRGQISARGTAWFSRPNATSSPQRARTVWACGSCSSRPVRARPAAHALAARAPGGDAVQQQRALLVAEVVTAPGARVEQPAEAGEQRRLARAARPEQQDALAGRDVEVEAAHGPRAAGGVPPPPARGPGRRRPVTPRAGRPARTRGRRGRRSAPAPGSATTTRARRSPGRSRRRVATYASLPAPSEHVRVVDDACRAGRP